MKTAEKEPKKGSQVPAVQGNRQLSTKVADYGEDAGRGYEGQSQADMSIPFLALIQTNSPQVTDREDCKPGMLFNTVTEELYDGLKEGILFVPAVTQHVFVEWKPRDQGGGFVATHAPESDVVKKAKDASKDFGKYSTPAGNDLVETFYVFAQLVDEVEGELKPALPIVIGFTSTKIAIYKKWNTKIKMFQIQTPDGRKQMPPLFAHLVRIKSYKETDNPKGDFFNFVLEPARTELADSLLEPGHACLEAAKAYKKLVEDNLVKLAHDSTTKTEGAATAGGEKKPKEVF